MDTGGADTKGGGGGHKAIDSKGGGGEWVTHETKLPGSRGPCAVE